LGGGSLMPKQISGWLRQVSTGWVALVSVVIFLLFSTLVLPRQAAQADVATGEIGSPDMSLVYSPQTLYDLADAYGPEGRQAYIRARFTFDLVWPIVYTLFLTTAISWLYGRTFAVGSRWQQANLIPLLGMLLDYLENISTSVVMARYPDATPIVVLLAPVFTLAKWVFVGGSFLLLLIGLFAAARQIQGPGRSAASG
jgi:hypothetical protein